MNAGYGLQARGQYKASSAANGTLKFGIQTVETPSGLVLQRIFNNTWKPEHTALFASQASLALFLLPNVQITANKWLGVTLALKLFQENVLCPSSRRMQSSSTALSGDRNLAEATAGQCLAGVQKWMGLTADLQLTQVNGSSAGVKQFPNSYHNKWQMAPHPADCSSPRRLASAADCIKDVTKTQTRYKCMVANVCSDKVAIVCPNAPKDINVIMGNTPSKLPLYDQACTPNYCTFSFIGVSTSAQSTSAMATTSTTTSTSRGSSTARTTTLAATSKGSSTVTVASTSPARSTSTATAKTTLTTTSAAPSTSTTTPKAPSSLVGTMWRGTLQPVPGVQCEKGSPPANAELMLQLVEFLDWGPPAGYGMWTFMGVTNFLADSGNCSVSVLYTASLYGYGKNGILKPSPDPNFFDTCGTFQLPYGWMVAASPTSLISNDGFCVKFSLSLDVQLAQSRSTF